MQKAVFFPFMFFSDSSGTEEEEEIEEVEESKIKAEVEPGNIS